MFPGFSNNGNNIKQEKPVYGMRNDLENIKYQSQNDNQHLLNKFREDIGNLTEICTNTINTVIDLSNELQILKAQFAEFKLSHTKKCASSSVNKKFYQTSECYVNDTDNCAIAHSHKKKKKKNSKNKNQHSTNDNKSGDAQNLKKKNEGINFDDTLAVYSNQALLDNKRKEQLTKKEKRVNDKIREIQGEYESFDQLIPVKLAHNKKNAPGTSNNTKISTCNKIKSESEKKVSSKEALCVSQPMSDMKQPIAKLLISNQFAPNDKIFKSSWPRNFHEIRDMMNFELLYKGNPNVEQKKAQSDFIQKFGLSEKSDNNDSKCLQRSMVQSRQNVRQSKNEVQNREKRIEHEITENNLSEQSESSTSKRSSRENTCTHSETKEAYSSGKSSENDTLVTIESKDSSSFSETETDSDSYEA